MNVHQHTVKRISKKKDAVADAQRDALGLEEREGQTLMNQPCWFGKREASVALHELKDESCRWPLEVDGCDELRYCSNAKGRGAYCLAHANISYTRAREPNKNHKPLYRASNISTAQWGR